LAHCWQMLLKGLDEVKNSTFPFPTLEMFLIRLSYLKHLPQPEDCFKQESISLQINNKAQLPAFLEVGSKENVPFATVDTKAYESIDSILNLLLTSNEIILYHNLKNDVKIISVENCKLTISLMDTAPKGFTLKLQKILNSLTGQKWQIIVSSEDLGISTIAEQDKLKERAYVNSIRSNSMVQEVLNTFNDLEIIDIKNKKII